MKLMVIHASALDQTNIWLSGSLLQSWTDNGVTSMIQLNPRRNPPKNVTVWKAISMFYYKIT